MHVKKLKRTVAFSLLVLSFGLFGTCVNAETTQMGSETELAGMSYILEQYCSVQLGTNVADPEAIIAFEETSAQEESTVSSGTSIEGENDKVEEKATAQATAKPESEYANVGISIAADYVNIRQKANTDATVVGKLYRGSAATIIKTEGDWVYIKSGSVSGYIKKEYLAIGYSAEKLIDDFGTKWATVTTETLRVRESESTDAPVLSYINAEESFEVLKEGNDWAKISLDDTNGYVKKEYIKITVQFKKAVSVEEEKEEARRKAAAEAAEKEEVTTVTTTHKSENKPSHKSSHKPSSSSSSHKSTKPSTSSSHSNSSSKSSKSSSSNGGGGGKITSHKSSSNGGGGSASKGSSSESSSSGGGGSALGSGDGSAVASYALKFVGNSYVYGGSSLTHGTDCSGFTMSVYKKFGINLPHSSAAQSRLGKSIKLSQAQAGDLIFYKNGGSVGHVALCIGGGRVVHASNSRVGIVTSGMYYRTPYCARRILN